MSRTSSSAPAKSPSWSPKALLCWLGGVGCVGWVGWHSVVVIVVASSIRPRPTHTSQHTQDKHVKTHRSRYSSRSRGSALAGRSVRGRTAMARNMAPWPVRKELERRRTCFESGMDGGDGGLDCLGRGFLFVVAAVQDGPRGWTRRWRRRWWRARWRRGPVRVLIVVVVVERAVYPSTQSMRTRPNTTPSTTRNPPASACANPGPASPLSRAPAPSGWGTPLAGMPGTGAASPRSGRTVCVRCVVSVLPKSSMEWWWW